MMNSKLKEDIRDLKAEIKLIKIDIDNLTTSFKSLKGYIYAKKIHLKEEKQEDLNNSLPSMPINGLF